MGKTLGTIITLAGAVVVNVVPGLGQLASAAILLGSAAIGAVVSGMGASPKPESASTAQKQPRPPRVSAYGKGRLYMNYALFETGTNGHAVDVGAIHDGKMDGVIQLYLNDDKVTLSGDYVQAGADGRYGNDNIRLLYTNGSSPGTWFSAVGAIVPGWTSNHRGDDVVMLAMIAKNVKQENYLKFYPNGAPIPSIAARWQLCPDFNEDQPFDETGWTWTENPIRQLGHYKLAHEAPTPTLPIDDPDYAAEMLALREAYYLAKIAPTLSYWRAAQDICDEAVPLKAGGTEPRYRSWVAHKHTDPHKAVNAAIMATCDGWISPRADGALVVYAGKHYEPTVTIGPADIVNFEWNGVGVDDDKAVNELVCSYVSADHDYNSVETDAWTDEADILERSQVLSDSLELPVPSHGQIRRLAKRRMAKTNALHRGTVTTNINGRAVRGERFIYLLMVVGGRTYFDGVAEITGLTRNIETGGVTFSWIAADPNIDAWNEDTEEGNPAALGDRVASEPLDAPTIDSVTPTYGQNTAYGVPGVKLTIEVTGPDRDDLTWFVRTREADVGVAWLEQRYPDVDPGASVTLQTDFLPLAVLDVEVAYSTGDGRLSPWASPDDPVSTDDAVPADLTGLSVSANTAGTLISADWDNSLNATRYLFELIVEP
jgi:hypothetical protein